VATLLLFVAQLFHWVLPNLQLFSPTQITDVPTNLFQLTKYSGEVACYSLMFTAIFLLFGLILFEDRDLA
jgi:ABC-type transport system involved in multi-copper enzyme maturation permease subunit